VRVVCPGCGYDAGDVEEVTVGANVECECGHRWVYEEITVRDQAPTTGTQIAIDSDESSKLTAVADAAKTVGGLLSKGFGVARMAVLRQRLGAKLPDAFLKVAADGRVTEAEEQQLRQIVSTHGWDWDEAVATIAPSAKEFLRRVLADVAADGEINDRERAEVDRYISLFRLETMRSESRWVFSRVETIWNLKNGKLPMAIPDRPVWLQSDEAVYYTCRAVYLNQRRQQITESPGLLYLTGSRTEFLGSDASCSHPHDHLRTCEAARRTHLVLAFHPRQGSGTYVLEDAPLAAAYLHCLARAANRTISITRDDNTTEARRRIPQETRHEVWTRDGGKCVDCSAEDYLEYDHIIPVSRGGANTAQNVQLLCRRCNSKKSDRI